MEGTINVIVDSKSLDEALEKAKQLNATLREAKRLIHDLSWPVALSVPSYLFGADLGKKGGSQTVYAEFDTRGGEGNDGET